MAGSAAGIAWWLVAHARPLGPHRGGLWSLGDLVVGGCATGDSTDDLCSLCLPDHVATCTGLLAGEPPRAGALHTFTRRVTGARHTRAALFCAGHGACGATRAGHTAAIGARRVPDAPPESAPRGAG